MRIGVVVEGDSRQLEALPVGGRDETSIINNTWGGDGSAVHDSLNQRGGVQSRINATMA